MLFRSRFAFYIKKCGCNAIYVSKRSQVGLIRSQLRYIHSDIQKTIRMGGCALTSTFAPRRRLFARKFSFAGVFSPGRLLLAGMLIVWASTARLG